MHNQGSIIWMLGIGFCLVIFLGVSGAITALGDTLYESESLAEGIQQDFSAASNILVRLRVWHPVIAIITGLYLALMVLKFSGIYQDRTSRVFSWFLGGLFLVQLTAGIVNLLLLAPITMQIIHLLLADSVWILLVLYTVSITRQTRFVHIE